MGCNKLEGERIKHKKDTECITVDSKVPEKNAKSRLIYIDYINILIYSLSNKFHNSLTRNNKVI